MKKLVIENTYYSILLYILYDRDWRNSDFKLIKGRISNKFIDRLETLVEEVELLEDFPRLRLKDICKSLQARLYFLSFLKDYDLIYGNVYEFRLKTDLSFIQIDDGLGTKRQLSGDWPKIYLQGLRDNFVMRRLFGFDYSLNSNNKSYLLPDRDDYRNYERKYNCNYIDLESELKFIKNEGGKRYQELIHLFSLKELSSKDSMSLLMLQPFYEDNLVDSLDEEITLYKRALLNNKIKENNLIIKPHPASNVDYSCFFPDAKIMDKDFPYELLLLLDMRFKKILTVNSSGLKTLSSICDEIVSFDECGIVYTGKR